jgi:hypothetical protein
VDNIVLLGVGRYMHGIESLASIFGCSVAQLPMKYFGLPLGVPYKSTSIWNGIDKKMERRVAGRKRLYLSKGRG